MSTHVHWHQGLFLQPHHFQQLQHSVYDEAAKARRFSGSFPYGICESRVSPDELANFRLRFEKLRVIMPSGIEVDFPDNAELPSFDLKPLFAGGDTVFRFYLAVPLWQAKRANSFAMGVPADPKEKLLYRLREDTILDENTGDNPKIVFTRRINARLITDQDDHEDMEIMPLMQVMRATGEQLGMPRIDAEYVAPSLFLEGSNVLRVLVQDLISQIEASRKELTVQLTRGGFSLETMRGSQYEQLLRLRTLNRFGSRLAPLTKVSAITPLAWYLELRELHGDLAALHPDRMEDEPPDYEHENLFHVFHELDRRIRGLLRRAVSASFLRLELTPEDSGFTGALTDEHLTRPVEYYLAIKSARDPREIINLVEDPDQFKLMPRSMATRAIRGVVLEEERVAPLQLPAQSGLTYFRLNRAESARAWQQIQAEKALVVCWPEMAGVDFQITLYMTTAG